MPSSRPEIRAAIKSLVETFYPHRVETVQRFSPPDTEQEYALIYFADGNAVEEGVSYAMLAQVQVAFFKCGVIDDSELDQYEDQLETALESDQTLQQLVRGFNFSGFSYAETDDDRVSGLILTFSIFY